MAVSAPQYILDITDLYGASQGVARYYDNLSGPIVKLNGTPTLSFRISGEDPLYGFMRGNQVGFCKLYRRYEGYTELLFHGQMIGRNETGDASGVFISATFAGPSWRLAHARASESSVFTGVASTFPTGAIDASLGTGIVLSREITLNRISQQLRFRAGSYTTPSTQPGAGVFECTYNGVLDAAGGMGGDVELDMSGYEYLSDLWNDVAGGVGGLDWYILPTERSFYDCSLSGSLLKVSKIGQLVLDTSMGNVNPDVVFQFGGPGANLESFELQTSWETRATTTFGRLADDTLVSSSSMTNPTGGRMDAWVPVSDLNVDLATDLVQEHALVRKYPRKVYTCVPNFAGPKYRTDFDIGDTVETRVTINNEPLVGGGVRVYGVDIEQRGDTIVEKPVLVADQ